MCGEPRPDFCPFVSYVYSSVCLSPGPCRCLQAGLSQDMRSLLSACPEHLLFLCPSLCRAALSSLLNRDRSFHDPAHLVPVPADGVSRCPGSESVGQREHFHQASPPRCPRALGACMLGHGAGDSRTPLSGMVVGVRVLRYGGKPWSYSSKKSSTLQIPQKTCSWKSLGRATRVTLPFAGFRNTYKFPRLKKDIVHM